MNGAKGWQAKLVVFSGIALFQASIASAMELNGFLDRVVEKHEGLSALRESQKGTRYRQDSTDIDLTPVLILQGGYLSDRKQPNMLGAAGVEAREYSVSLAKKFSTGTSVQLSAKSGGYENVDLANATYTNMGFGRYGQGGMTLALSQSLWKNAFGAGYRLRDQRANFAAKAEAAGVDLQERQILTEAEGIFWERIYLQEEVRVRQASLERAKKLEAWIKRRSQDGIADQADVLTMQALTATRELQLSVTEDEYTANEKKIRDLLQLKENEPIGSFDGSLKQARPLRGLVAGPGKVVRIDAWAALKEAQAKKAGADEAQDALKSDLVLSGSYGTNAFDPHGDASSVSGDLQKTDHPTKQLALTWTYLFDNSAKDAANQLAKTEGISADLRSQRKLKESDLAWSEIQRRHEELQKKIASSEQIVKLQAARAKAEQNKFSRGRSVTTTVIAAEQDAAESELQLIRMSIERRKLEAQARLFMGVGEAL